MDLQQTELGFVQAQITDIIKSRIKDITVPRLTLGSHEELLLDLVSVGIPEVGPGEGGAAAGVVDDALDDTLDVTMTLGEVDSPEGGLALPVLSVRHEDGAGALPLGTNDTTHL